MKRYPLLEEVFLRGQAAAVVLPLPPGAFSLHQNGGRRGVRREDREGRVPAPLHQGIQRTPEEDGQGALRLRKGWFFVRSADVGLL